VAFDEQMTHSTTLFGGMWNFSQIMSQNQPVHLNVKENLGKFSIGIANMYSFNC
jgi:hypothetical protein